MWQDILEDVRERFRDATVSIKADFLTDVARELELSGDEEALRRRTYYQAITRWGNH